MFIELCVAAKKLACPRCCPSQVLLLRALINDHMFRLQKCKQPFYDSLHLPVCSATAIEGHIKKLEANVAMFQALHQQLYLQPFRRA